MTQCKHKYDQNIRWLVEDCGGCVCINMTSLATLCYDILVVSVLWFWHYLVLLLTCFSSTLKPASNFSFAIKVCKTDARIQREEGNKGSGTSPLKNRKNIWILSNTRPDPLKITKLPSQHSVIGQLSTPVKLHLNGVSLAGRLWPA